MTDLTWLIPIAAAALISFVTYLTKRVFDLSSEVKVLQAQRDAELRAIDRIERKLDEL